MQVKRDDDDSVDTATTAEDDDEQDDDAELVPFAPPHFCPTAAVSCPSIYIAGFDGESAPSAVLDVPVHAPSGVFL